MKKIILLLCIVYSYTCLKAQNVNFDWVDHLGEIYWEKGNSITVDASGNVYTTGSFSGVIDFDPGPAVFNLSAPNDTYGFVTKYNSNGQFIWAKSFEGSSVRGESVKVDASGNIYTAGRYMGRVDLDPGPGIFVAPAGDYTFISKLDASGNFIWGKTISNRSIDNSTIHLDIDASSNIYLSSLFAGQWDCDPGPAVSIITATDNGIDNYVMKWNKDGNFIWAKSFGSKFPDYLHDIKVDNIGNIYVTGDFDDTCDFDPGPGVFNLFTYATAAYVLKLNTNGEFVWVKNFGYNGPSGYEAVGTAITVDKSENVYIGGIFYGEIDFDPGSGTYNLLSSNGDCFLSKLDQSGNFLWAKNFGATPADFILDIDLDLNGNLYSTGYFYGTADFDPGAGNFYLSSAGNKDAFIQKLFPDGKFAWAKKMGGTLNDNAVAIAVDNASSVYTIGGFEGIADFDPGANVVNLSSLGFDDIFILKLSRCTNNSFNVINITTCSNYVLNAQTYTATGIYTQTIPNTAGCDSIITLNLTINRKYTAINAAICASETYFAGGANQTGSGIYKDTLQTSLGCDSIVTTTLTVHPKPIPNLGPDRNLCSNGVASITPGSFNNYLWQDNSIQPAFTVSGIGKYWVKVTDANNCPATDTLQVLAIDTVPKNFLPANLLLCYNSVFNITVPNYKNYLWSTGDVSPSVALNQFGPYYLTVTDYNNCSGKDTIVLLRNYNCSPVSIPNAFTPNKDGKNDIFKPIITQEITNYSFVVFNRYGQKIFASNEYGKGWDGTFKGAAQPRNSYIYLVNFKNSNGKPAEYKGTVTLLR